MIRMILACFVIGCITAADVPDPNQNAALDWWRAINAYQMDKDNLATLAENDPLKADLGDPRLDAQFGREQRCLELLAVGAGNPYCAWGVDIRREGPSAPLPYLNNMRCLVRLVLVRARWHASHKRHAAATGDLLLAIRTGRLCAGRTPALIDVLTCFGIEGQGCTVAAALLPSLDQPSLQRLAAGLSTMPPASGIADAFNHEVGMLQWAVDSMLALPPLKRPGVLQQLGGAVSSADALRLLPDVTDEKLRGMLGAYTAEIVRWQEHLRRPPAGRLPLPEMWSGGKSPSPLLDSITPAFQMIARRELLEIQRRAMLQAALGRCVSGDAGMAAHPDPLSGSPFGYAATPGGFRLTASAIGTMKPLQLEVGATATDPAAPGTPATGF